MQEYSLAELRRLFGLPPTLIRKLGQVGCITHGSARGKGTYTFQDLSILRVASALKSAKVSSPKIVAALRRIQADLPPGRELSTVTLAASGKDVSMHEGSLEWEASGQYALPLLIKPRAGQVARLSPPNEVSRTSLADEYYRRGHVFEDSDVVAARAAYLAALRIQEDHLEARINLGRLLHLDGQLKEAENLYREAKSSGALLSFNLAVLLEDLDREEEAIAAYHDALVRDPLLHDAHFNLFRLYEKSHRRRDALRHLLAYRRHMARDPE